MNKYFIEVKTDKNIGSKEFATAFLNELYYNLDEKLKPERFNGFEPIRHSIAEFGLETVIEKWPQMLKRVSDPKYDFDYNWRTEKGLDKREFPWSCMVWQNKKAGDALVIKFFEFIIRHFDPAFGFVATWNHHEERNRIKCKSKLKGCISEAFFTGTDVTETFPGIFWLTYFSNNMMARIGREKFDSLQVLKSWKYHDGIIIQAYEKCFDENMVAENNIIDQLGSELFFNKAKYIADNNLEIIT